MASSRMVRPMDDSMRCDRLRENGEWNTMKLSKQKFSKYLQDFKPIEKTQRAEDSQNTNQSQHSNIRNKKWNDEVQSTNDNDEEIQAIPSAAPVS